MKKLIAAALLVPSMAISQELVEFKNGQVADAEKLNQNFANLAARIQLESGGEPFYTWLGYTPTSLAAFVEENEIPYQDYFETSIPITQYLASKHCKATFGASAFAATDDIIEYFLMTGDSFYPPNEPGAIVFSSVSDSPSDRPSRRLRVDGDFRQNPSSSFSVACVKITGLP